MKPIFAVDVGGVLASKQHDGVPREGALEALADLDSYFTLWVVSQCGKNRALMTKAWLKEWAFPIPLERQIYVGFNENKWEPLRKLKAIYFVDDRLKHVVPALGLPMMYRVFHLPEQVSDRLEAPQSEKYRLVTSWAEIVQATRNVT